MAHNDLRPENVYVTVINYKKITVKLSLSF